MSNKNIYQKLKDIFVKKEEVKEQKTRGFEAAKYNRLTSDWNPIDSHIDNSIYNDGKRLRLLSRDLSLNNDYYKRFLSMYVNNTVGPNGFKLQVKGSDYIFENGQYKEVLDTVANNIIEENFSKWSDKKYCEITGKYSFLDLKRVIVKSLARDGEVLIREIKDKKINKFGYTLQLLRIDRLDELLNKQLNNGNYIKMGIEFDNYGRVVAYHIRKQVQSDNNVNGTIQLNDYERISADEIIHLFKIEFPEQTRGFCYGHSVINTLKMLNSLTESALVNARVGASKMGFYKQEKNTNSAESLADYVEDGELITEVSPGEFGILPEGFSFQEFNPTFPSDSFETFHNSILRSCASGLNVSYNMLANNLAEVNYSSIRAGLLDERSFYMEEQQFIIDNLLNRIYENWLEQSLFNEVIKFNSGKSLPFSQLEKFKKYNFIGRRWAWVDPLKDISASIKAIDYKLKSRSKIVSEEGVDYEDVLMDIQKEEEYAKKYNINLTVDGKLNTINSQDFNNLVNEDIKNNDK